MKIALFQTKLAWENPTINRKFIEEYFLNEDESFDFFVFEDEEEEEDYILDEEVPIDESELIVFLNEYYTVNPDNVPKSELF